MSDLSPTELWLVRHGETEWSRSGQHTSVTDLPLTVVGEAAARSLAPRLAQQNFGLVLTSPRLRAIQTAELAGFPHAKIDDDLVEWAYGVGEGLTTAQIQERVPHWRIWTHGAPRFGDDLIADQVGETKTEVAARLARVVARVHTSGVERVLIFGHGHALRVLATVWCGLPIEAGWHFPLATATLSVLGYEKTMPALVCWNCGER